MEERVWRDAGRFNETDYENVKKMTNIKRGDGDVDRVFVSYTLKHLYTYFIYNLLDKT